MTKRRNRPTTRPRANATQLVGLPPSKQAPEVRVRPTTLLAVAIAVVTFVVFSPALLNDFLTWDDDRNFVHNFNYRGLGLDQLHWMWTTTHLGHYVPLSWMTLGLDYTLWGVNAHRYHLTNVILHCAVAALAFFVARRVLNAAGVSEESERHLAPYFPAAFAALLFALHPLRVESVAWVTERRDLLSELFALASVLLYLESHDVPESQRRYYWLSVAAFALALLSKAIVVTLPLILLLLDVYPFRRLTFADGWKSAAARRLYLEKLPYVILSAAAGLIALYALPPRAQLTIAAKIAVSAYGLCFYLWKTLLPFSLSPLYQMPAEVHPFAVRFLLSYVMVALISFGAVRLRRRYPGILVAWIAFVIITLPMLGIVQNGPQIAADRYTYHAGLILTILAAAVFAHFYAMRRERAMYVGAAVLLLFSILSWRQVHVWRDSETFWAYTAAHEPRSALAKVSLANEFVGDSDSVALALYAEAVKIDAKYPVGENDYGVELRRVGRLDDAIVHFHRAIQLSPKYADAHNNLGSALAAQGNLDGAVAQFQVAASLDPTMSDVHFNWGNALFKSGDLAGAVTHYQEALSLRPEDLDVAKNLSLAQDMLRASSQRRQ
jgi:protein O-mannosyl-transferase